MEKKLLKYEKFINENLLDTISGGIKSMFTTSSSKIKTIISKMIQVEKDFIDKTDELSFNIFMAQTLDSRKKVKAPGVSPLLKQKALISKKALDAFEKSRDSQIANLQDDLMRIIKKDRKLAEYYNKEAANADKVIADYAYKVAKRHHNGQYADTYQAQFLDMENLRKSLGNTLPATGNKTDQDGELEEISEIGEYKIEKPYCLKWEFFIQYLQGRTEQELIKWKHDGFAIKLRYLDEHKELISELNARKKFLNTEKNRYAANAPIYDVEIEEIERNKKAAENRLEAFKNYMRMKVDYIGRLVNSTEVK